MWIGAGLAIVGLLGAVGVVVTRLAAVPKPAAAPGCGVTFRSTTFVLDLEQAQHATTIAAIGKRMGLPDHAVTVALAAALQESQLHNLAHGDLDSLGLFQQRPSQGWGSATQVMTPSYAATAFYEHLAQIPGWETLPVTVAAQQVQRSGAPDAYAAWELEARGLAQALTGEVPAGLTCRLVDPPSGASSSQPLAPAVSTELGAPALGAALPGPRGWTVASWLVGHATQFGVTSVAFDGRRWRASSGDWQAEPTAGTTVQLTRGPAA